MKLIAITSMTALLAVPALAQESLRIQSHYAPEQTSGKLAQQFADDIEVMSNGEIDVEMFFSSSVVKTVESFDAAANGILDCDMTGAAYQTGKNPAFQFVGDIMGGYETPWQQYAWLYNGGFDAADALYNQFNMKLVGWWIYGQESMVADKPLATADDLKDWKFRSPPGMETEIFAALGATPVVMDFTEVFTALETGIIDGSDYSGLANDRSIGLFDVVKHATYPGFHSMPSDHLACRLDKWESLSEAHRRIIDTAMQKLAFQTALTFEVENRKAAEELPAEGVTLYDWSAEDRQIFRDAARTAWEDWATKTPETKSLVDSHIAFMTTLGLIQDEGGSETK